MAEKASDIAQRILALARKKADHAEVIYMDSESRSVQFQDNRLKTCSSGASRGVGLRVIHRGRLGFSSTNDFDAIDRLISNALDSAAFGQEAKFSLPGRLESAPQVKVFDPTVPQLSMERAAEITRQGIACILEKHPETHCAGGIGIEWGRTVICNTAGLHYEELSSDYDIGVGGFLVRGESFLWVDEGQQSCRRSDDILPYARKVVEWIDLCAKEVRLKEEQLPVIFTPSALEILLATLELNTNGKTVQKGASVLAKRLGERVLDSRITLWDDPLVDFAAGAMSVDAEGVPARRNVLFEDGVLKCFLYDLQTAGLVGAQSTGSAMRGYASAPSPGNTNLRMKPGSTPYSKMLADLKRGLLIDAALGAGQSNVLAGDFAVNVELGFLIENGQIVGRVKDCMLAGNAFDAFNRIRDISAEVEWHGAAELPYVCFDSLSVAGRAG